MDFLNVKKTTAHNNIYPETLLHLSTALNLMEQKILHKSNAWRIQGKSKFLSVLLAMSYNTLIWISLKLHVL